MLVATSFEPNLFLCNKNIGYIGWIGLSCCLCCAFVQVLQSQQQSAIVKSPQVTLATPMVTLRGQPHSRIVVGQPPVQVKQLNTGV